MALDVAPQAGDAQNQRGVHLTPVAMELLVADTRLLRQQGKRFEHDSPSFGSLPAPYSTRLRACKVVAIRLSLLRELSLPSSLLSNRQPILPRRISVGSTRPVPPSWLLAAICYPRKR